MKINFGVSDYSRFYPGAPWKERIMEIPSEGELPKIPEWVKYLKPDKTESCKIAFPNYSDYREDKYTLLPAVLFHLADEHYRRIYLIWIKERKEWVAVINEEWEESTYRTDEEEHGPYSLNDYCFDRLRQAYSVPPEKSLQEALEMISLELKEEEHSK